MRFPFSLVILSSTSTLASPIHEDDAAPLEPLSLFVFGDSYTDSGFRGDSPFPSVKQPFGYPPIGTSPDDLLGNPLIANKTSANGAVWPEYLAAKYNTTTTLLYDFALSGASIPDGFTDEILNTYEPRFSGLQGDPTLSASTEAWGWNSNTSIFASWIGINDINWCSKLFSTTPNVSFAECMPARMDAYFALMDNLYNTGARNFFFVNMPPLQRAPMVFEHGEDTISNYAEGVELFNSYLLPAYVEKFEVEHSDVRTVIYDAHTTFSEMLDHPSWYGFRDSTCYSCIGCYNVTGCFWSNNYHPVTQVHERLAVDMVANLTAVGWPAAVPFGG